MREKEREITSYIDEELKVAGVNEQDLPEGGEGEVVQRRNQEEFGRVPVLLFKGTLLRFR